MVDAEIRQRCERFRDWEDDFLEKGPFNLQGATEAQIQSLLDFVGCPLPEDYLEFLRFSNGFLDLLSVEDVLRDTLFFQEYESGGLVIGNDGGEGIIVLDLHIVLDLRDGAASAMSYAYMPDERHDWEHVGARWPDFKALFLKITPDPDKLL